MLHMNNVMYKGHVLSAIAVTEREVVSATLVVRDPSGVQRRSGALGTFASPIGALRYAFAYGMAEIDHRKMPPSE
ncbi:hypothetical protein AWB66_06399 [Caballeronia telluris]|uniref:Uncharacterized protein n=1 Tax=Caballeronia telluris TaxID=326475 RepID=A0A158KKJ4_9BURK|nr:hypothetical protein AWB66_06399 [Caballeronia telluris]